MQRGFVSAATTAACEAFAQSRNILRSCAVYHRLLSERRFKLDIAFECFHIQTNRRSRMIGFVCAKLDYTGSRQRYDLGDPRLLDPRSPQSQTGIRKIIITHFHLTKRKCERLRLDSGKVRRLASDPDHPAFVPTQSQYIKKPAGLFDGIFGSRGSQEP